MDALFSGLTAMTWREAVMLVIGGVLIYLAVKKEYEPVLLLPIGFGAILSNIPGSSAIGEHGFLTTLYETGIVTELFPLLILIGIGAMVDFGPLFEQPSMLFFGAAAQFGIFFTMAMAVASGFVLKDAASIATIGTADGPTAIYVATRFAPDLLAPISVAAYSYMSLVPIIQPPVVKLLTTKEERRIKMEPTASKKISKTVRILFPIIITIVAGLVAPISLSLVGTLCLEPAKESGVVERLAKTAQNELANIVTLCWASQIDLHDRRGVLTPKTLLIIGMGSLPSCRHCGTSCSQDLNLFLKRKINPMIGGVYLGVPHVGKVHPSHTQQKSPATSSSCRQLVQTSRSDRVHHRRRHDTGAGQVRRVSDERGNASNSHYHRHLDGNHIRCDDAALRRH